MNERSLILSINGRQVGTIREINGYWAFQYSEAWLKERGAYPISPALPLQAEEHLDNSSSRKVAWFFDNLLPEEAERINLAKEVNLSEADAWGLLSAYGAESAGALTLLPPGTSLPESGYRPLSMQDLNRRINDLPIRPLTAGSPKRMSLAGAQAKLAVAWIAPDHLFEPVGNAPSMHILKPDSRAEAYPHTAANEYFCMTLAHRLGLPVPPTHFFYTSGDGHPIYLVNRFDREVPAATPQSVPSIEEQLSRFATTARIQSVDTLQLLGLDRAFKYTLANVTTIREALTRISTPARARNDLFSWTVFNVLIGNADAHLKNISFLIDSQGIRLAPFYDLVSTAVYNQPEPGTASVVWHQKNLSMPIGKAHTFQEIGRDDLFAFAEELNVPRTAANRILTHFANHSFPLAQTLLTNGPFDLKRGQEQRLLRGIVYLPISEITAKLKSQ